MKRNFKFEVGQYVKIADRVVDVNKDFPKYPCKITYRFFDRNNNVYLLDAGENKEIPILEVDLTFYSTDVDSDTVLQMKKEILSLQERITKLEFDILNGIHRGISISASKIEVSKEWEYDESEPKDAKNVCLSND